MRTFLTFNFFTAFFTRLDKIWKLSQLKIMITIGPKSCMKFDPSNLASANL